MDIKTFESITDCLGSKEDRYFSSGFKSIDVIYNDIQYKNGVFSSNINVGTDDGWSKKNGKSLTPHLGTTEFVSIAAVVTQHLLVKELNFGDDDIETSWISRFVCKVRQCTNIDYNSIPVSGRIMSTNPQDDLVKSIVQVQIGTVQVVLHVCHPRVFPPKTCESSDHTVDLYQKGYKLRDHSITDVVLDENCLTSLGSVTLFEDDVRKKGIGAMYSGMMLTDFVLVTGQLTQALLCHLNRLDRERSNNLWLREIDVWCETPSNERKCNSEVKFLKVNVINLNNETWQSIEMSGSLGNMNSKIKVAQKKG